MNWHKFNALKGGTFNTVYESFNSEFISLDNQFYLEDYHIFSVHNCESICLFYCLVDSKGINYYSSCFTDLGLKHLVVEDILGILEIF